jgi:hypothetical protein
VESEPIRVSQCCIDKVELPGDADVDEADLAFSGEPVAGEQVATYRESVGG